MLDLDEGAARTVVGVVEQVGDVEDWSGGDAVALEQLGELVVVEVGGPGGQLLVEVVDVLDTALPGRRTRARAPSRDRPWRCEDPATRR